MTTCIADIKGKILVYLENSAATAVELRHFFKISHEAVYLALVQMEAEGSVCVRLRAYKNEILWSAVEEFV
jgi:predicted transcriptional regulator